MAEKLKFNKSAYDQQYTKENIARKLLTFNRNNPSDIRLFDWINSQGNATEYIKRLIREDMKKAGA